MNANDHDRDHAKRLDEYIDALNAGRPAPQVADDADLADLFATARDLHRLRAAEPARDDVPSRLAAALERELRANPKHGTRQIESKDMRLFRDASSNGSLRPPDVCRAYDAVPRRPERIRQWAQFFVAAVAFALIGVVLAQIIGSSVDEPSSAVGTDPDGTPTTAATVLAATATSPVSPSSAVIRETPVIGVGIPLPTPDESTGDGVVTFQEAQEVAVFELAEPANVPEPLSFGGISLRSVIDPTNPESWRTGPVDQVEAFYQYSESGREDVRFWQTTRGCEDLGTDDAMTEDVEIGEKTVRRTVRDIDGIDQQIEYQWQTSAVCYIVMSRLSSGVSVELLDTFVAAIPTLDAVIVRTPPAEPAFAGPEFATLSVSPDYVNCESEVVARGTGFAPGTTVVIYGGPLFGDNFGPVSDDIPVAENGGFELVIDVGRIFAQCRGAEIDQEGSRYALGAETGSSLTKNDFEGPSAMTAITFSSTVPDALKDRPRLPSCGTEVIRTETDFTPQGESDVQARECFAAAVNAGSPAEFISYVQNSDFEIQTMIYHTIEADTVEIIRDRTTRGRWEQYTCNGLTLPDKAPVQFQYQFQFETCGGTVAIE